MHSFRRLIMICETSHDTREDSLYSAVVKAVRGIGEPDDTPDIEWVHGESKKFENLDDSLHLYRMLGLKSFPKLKDGSKVGQHWTEDWEALAHYGNFYTPKNSHLFVLHGVISSDEINVAMTLAYRFLFPEEHEIFVKSSAIVFLDGISKYPSENLLVDKNGRWIGRGLRVTV